ncbi:MAG: hypothetical protein GY906_39060 [bacterium]|nr:hypothetical protein [bacterium]
MQANEAQIEMVNKFQCPGCVCGTCPDDCPSFKFDDNDGYGFQCDGHVAGTMVLGVDSVYLGLPKGFSHVGDRPRDVNGEHVKSHIRMWDRGDPGYDHLNVPVWAMEKDGFLFVRCYCPRSNRTFVDVIKGMSFDALPDIARTNVAEILDAID